MEFASGTLGDIAGLYAAPDEATFTAKREALGRRFAQLEAALTDAPAGPWFAGERFGLVDAAFGPVFRYLDTFEALVGLHLAPEWPKAAAWRAALAVKPSVASAVAPDYPDRLEAFLRARGSHLSRLITERTRPS